jgi:nucleotide-binding universal stress UspA family protein
MADTDGVRALGDIGSRPDGGGGRSRRIWRKATRGGSVNGAIICGVDDSDSAKGAARVARALSSELGLGVVFVRAIDGKAVDEDVNAIAQRLESLSAGINGADSGAAWSVEVGHPADALVAAAKKAQATMIVVGSTGPRSSLLGSVSADVSRRAPCPVVVVPPGADTTVDRSNAGASTSSGHFAGGLVRFGIGEGGTEVAGGVARFSLGAGKREP